MANNRKLLLPYAYDSTSNLVHIDNAHKEEIYKCPECGKILSLNISKIPEGQKYHRRNHFSHPKGSPDNNCSESFLHKLFKERVAAYIQKQITDGKTEFTFTWKCNECSNLHSGNLLRKAKSVCIEYTLDNCRPDIVLLDNDGKAVIVIEVVVTHSPEPEVLEYYRKKRIGCLQFNVFDYNDCEHIEDKLSHPDFVNLCTIPICKKCGRRMNKAKMVIMSAPCNNCGRFTRIALIEANRSKIFFPEKFAPKDIELANQNGANIRESSNNSLLYLNVCSHCNIPVDTNHISSYFEFQDEKTLVLEYRCYCSEIEKMKEKELKWEIECQLNEITRRNGKRTCPLCGNELIVNYEGNGYYYNCSNNVNCHYTEIIVLED